MESREKQSGLLINDKMIINNQTQLLLFAGLKLCLKKFIAICKPVRVDYDFLMLVFFTMIEQYCLFLKEKKNKAAWITNCLSQDRTNHSNEL